MEELKFENFEQKYIHELNSWHDKEHGQNLNGLTQFIVPEDVLLGDYLEFVENSMPDVKNLLAFDNDKLVGFLGFANPQENHTHIEFVAVNPDCRGKGYANRILAKFKEEVLARNPNTNITLAVKKSNTAGLNSFSKIAKQSKTQDNEGYVQFEL